MHSDYLVAPQGDCDRDIQGLVDHPSDGLDQRHEEQREPDDADEQDYDHPAHAVLHHLLFLLPPRLGVSLQRESVHKAQAAAPRSRWAGERSSWGCASI